MKSESASEGFNDQKAKTTLSLLITALMLSIKVEAFIKLEKSQQRVFQYEVVSEY